MFFHSDVREAEGDTVNQRHLALQIAAFRYLPRPLTHTHTHIHLPVDAMSLTWREEHLHFSSLVSLNSHADSRDGVCVCVCVWMRLPAVCEDTVYVSTNKLTR